MGMNTGLWSAVLSASAFATLGLFAKHLLEHGYSVSNVLFLRFTVAAAVLWLIAFASGRIRPVKANIVIVSLLMGLVGYAGQATLFLVAVAKLKSGLASILLYLYPFVVFGLSALLSKRWPKTGDVGILSLAFVGAALTLELGTGSLSVVGVGAGIGAAVWYGCYLVVSERLTATSDPLVVSALVFTGAALSLAFYGVFFETYQVPATASDWFAVVGLSVLSTALPVVALFYSIKMIGSKLSAAVSNLEPVVTVVLGWILLSEELSPAQILGITTVFASVILLPLRNNKRKRGATARVPEPAEVRSCNVTMGVLK